MNGWSCVNFEEALWKFNTWRRLNARSLLVPLSENVDQKGKIIFNILFSKCLVLDNPHSILLLFYYIIGSSELKTLSHFSLGYETWLSILVCPLSNLLIYELITAIGHTDINKLSIFSQQKWKYQQTPPVSWNNKLGKQRISSLSW